MTRKSAIEEEGAEHPNHDFFFGHEQILLELEKRLVSARLHHSWLIEGKEGIGKATLAWRVAQFLLASPNARLENLAISKNTEAWNLTRAGSHPDFLYVRPALDNKTQTITIGDIRQVGRFFTKSPALGAYRICIIDAVDNMNINAANGLLKILEEPPKHAMLFLVSHRSGSVLATLRSRCQRLKLSPLPDETLRGALAQLMPKLTQEEIRLAVHLSAGSLGKAQRFASKEGRGLYEDFREITKNLTHLDSQAVQKFCNTYAKDKPNYDLLCDLILDWSHGITTKTPLAKKGLKLWDETNAIIKATDRLNMDKNSAALKLFSALEKLAER